MKHELRTEIDIEASPEDVWTILTDLSHYSDWNPFVVSSHGTVAVGQRLMNRLRPPGGKTRTFKPTVTIVDPPRTFEWLGHLGFPGIFDGRHRFELTATRTGTHLAQIEHFSGLLVRFALRSLDEGTVGGFNAMNLALKARVEHRPLERSGPRPRPAAPADVDLPIAPAASKDGPTATIGATTTLDNRSRPSRTDNCAAASHA